MPICAYAVCTSDSRKNEKDVTFVPFPKPWLDKKRTKRWLHLCGRDNFGINRVTRNTYICSKHFHGNINLDWKYNHSLEPFHYNKPIPPPPLKVSPDACLKERLRKRVSKECTSTSPQCNKDNKGAGAIGEKQIQQQPEEKEEDVNIFLPDEEVQKQVQDPLQLDDNRFQSNEDLLTKEVENMVYQCKFRGCNSDSRKREANVSFIPFVKPWLDRARAERWIQLSNQNKNKNKTRRAELTLEMINKDTHLCSKHFPTGVDTDWKRNLSLEPFAFNPDPNDTMKTDALENVDTVFVLEKDFEQFKEETRCKSESVSISEKDFEKLKGKTECKSELDDEQEETDPFQEEEEEEKEARHDNEGVAAVEELETPETVTILELKETIPKIVRIEQKTNEPEKELNFVRVESKPLKTYSRKRKASISRLNVDNETKKKVDECTTEKRVWTFENTFDLDPNDYNKDMKIDQDYKVYKKSSSPKSYGRQNKSILLESQSCREIYVGINNKNVKSWGQAKQTQSDSRDEAANAQKLCSTPKTYGNRNKRNLQGSQSCGNSNSHQGRINIGVDSKNIQSSDSRNVKEPLPTTFGLGSREEQLCQNTGLSSDQLNVMMEKINDFPDFEIELVKEEISSRDQLIMTMTCLRQGLELGDLAEQFERSPVLVEKICRTWIELMSQRCKEVQKELFSAQDGEKPIPPFPFRNDLLSNCRIVLDVLSLWILQPDEQWAKNFRALIAVNTEGYCIFNSKVFSEKSSIREMVDESQVLHNLDPSDSVLVGVGYNIEDLCSHCDLELVKPPDLRRLKIKSLSKSELAQLEQINIARCATVTNFSTKLKQFKAISKSLPRFLNQDVSDVVSAICFCVNFQKKFSNC